jgi:hypothetical protein
LTGGAASATIAAAMPTLGRAMLLLLVAISLVAVGIPPALDEDRSVPGFCSPDCPLQQVAHAVAVAPAPLRPAVRVEATRERRLPEQPVELPSSLTLPDAPRAPPVA